MTQAKFGEQFGVKGVAVSQWERGETIPSVEVLTQIADYANESIDWLFGRDTSPLKKDEHRLLRFYRGCSEAGKEEIKDRAEDIFFEYPQN
jgi:transcriptional regulator with XRE-family HTH domain